MPVNPGTTDRHFQRPGHPLVASLEPGERWAWCYVDDIIMPLPPALLPNVESPIRSHI
jgi:CPA2 family monovalent cation:H+ antiporter-2